MRLQKGIFARLFLLYRLVSFLNVSPVVLTGSEVLHTLATSPQAGTAADCLRSLKMGRSPTVEPRRRADTTRTSSSLQSPHRAPCDGWRSIESRASVHAGPPLTTLSNAATFDDRCCSASPEEWGGGGAAALFPSCHFATQFLEMN